MPVFTSSDIVQMILNAGLMVRFVLLLLLFFSVTSWAIIFYKYRLIGKARKESAYFLDLFWNRQSLSKAFAASKQLRYSPLARVFRIAYLELKKVNASQLSSGEGEKEKEGGTTLNQDVAAVDNIKRALRRAANVELTGLNRALSFLATTGNTTPFIGRQESLKRSSPRLQAWLLRYRQSWPTIILIARFACWSLRCIISRLIS
jgi:biopolymer transport protein TolQ